MATAAGVAVPARPRPAGRPVRSVVLLGNGQAMIDFRQATIGFADDQAHQAGLAFAAALHELVKTAGRDLDPVEDRGRDFRPAAPALDLSAGECQRVLFRLKELGRPLRQALAKGTLLDKLRLDADPALTFAQEDRAPVLWDMLYDADKGEPFGTADWRRFWGFSRPVSHWIGCNRESGRIDLRTGLMTGVSDDLAEARAEADWLRGVVGDRFRVGHRSLAGSLWDRARAAAGGTPGGSLADHLRACSPHNPDGWASEVLADILRGTADEVQHFACHGRADPHTQLRSRLVFLMDGDTEVGVNVAQFSADDDEVPFDAPGRLVFLNACSTAQPGQGREPPGLPDVWITHRGAVAVVVTLCPVPDAFAAAFARKFYETLFGGTPVVAEAFLATRRHFMERHNNPLGLAYVLYAFPGAHVAGGGDP